MKRIIIIGILFLLLISSVSAKSFITQTELETYTNTQIKNYLVNNFGYTKAYLNNNSLVVYAKYNGLRQSGNRYLLTPFNLKARLDKNVWDYCINTYTLEQCKTNLVYNYGYFEFNNVSYKTINQQFKEKLIIEYNKIINWRDYSNTDVQVSGVVTI